MPKKCVVRTLSDSCLAELANSVVSAIELLLHNYSIINNLDIIDLYQDDYKTIIIVEVQSYLQDLGATTDVYQDLLHIILASNYLEASIRFTCLQTLLNDSVQTLVTGNFPNSYYDKVLQVIADQGNGLKMLNLKGVWVKIEQMNLMHEIINKCPNLTKLCIPYIANDELLQTISESSKNLKIIDISGETDITEIGIEYLSKGISSSNLIVVDIGILGEENICHSDIAMILEYCPNIESLATYSFVGSALKFIHENVNENMKFKLKYLHDTRTEPETLDVITKMCPNLESIYLDTPRKGILHKLNNTLIHNLKIHKFSCDELMKVLEKLGRLLVQLTMIKGTGALDLYKIARFCSGLIDLDCYMMDLLMYSCDVKFECLQGLEILKCPMDRTSLKHFVCNTTSLKRLAIDMVTFTDEDFKKIFIEHDFYALEDVWFTSAPYLSVSAVEILINRCPELQSIGQLRGWSLTPDDFLLINGILKSGNSCVVLSPSNFF